MTDRELIVELCEQLHRVGDRLHDLAPGNGSSYRAREAALRRMLAVCEAAVEWRKRNRGMTTLTMTERDLAAAVDALDKETP